MSTLKKSASNFHHGDLKASLIAAGVKQVDRCGLNSLSLRQLSLATGVSQTAAYRHFQDLEHLKAEVSKAAREALGTLMLRKLKSVRGIGSKQVSIDRLWQAGAAYIEFGIRHPNQFEIAFVTFLSPELEVEDPSPWGILNKCLDDLLEAQVISNAVRDKAPMIAWSMVHGFAGLAAQGFTGTERETKASMKIVLNSVLRSLGIE
ncbi:MAG: TetR/AcrR family transcriptional regulator [Candidatus Planktophila sp.]